MTETSSSGNRDQRRAANFRENIGQRVSEKETAKAYEALKPELAIEYANMVRLREAGTVTAVSTPTTTRGIGLNVAFTHQFMSNRFQRFLRWIPTSVHQLYRFSLTQLSYQLFESHRSQANGTFYDSTLASALGLGPEFKEYYHNLKVKSNLSMVASSISSVGMVTAFDSTFRCYVPSMEYTEETPMETDSTLMVKRPRVSKTIIPDPYLITISNLREVVVALSDPNTSADIRSRFKKLCPIPGAVWNGDLLMNPNDIMPTDYSSARFMDDQEAVSNYLAAIAKCDARHISVMPLDGIGCNTILATCTQINQHEAWKSHSVDFKNESDEYHSIRCHLPVQPSIMLKACADLMSEWPVDWDIVGIQNMRWALRSPWLSQYVVDYSWLSLVNGILSMVD